MNQSSESDTSRLGLSESKPNGTVKSLDNPDWLRPAEPKPPERGSLAKWYYEKYGVSASTAKRPFAPLAIYGEPDRPAEPYTGASEEMVTLLGKVARLEQQVASLSKRLTEQAKRITVLLKAKKADK